MPFKRCSPEPSRTGRMARCSSSIRAARRYCRIPDTPPPRRTSRPPAAAVARPRAPDRTEHIAPENPGTDSGKALLRYSVVDPRLSTVKALHLPPHPCGEEPLHQLRAPDAERILETLVGPGPVAVDGNREALDAEFRHYIPRCLVSGTGRRCPG